MNLTFADPTEWWLEIWPKLQAEDWRACYTLATPSRRRSFFLNQLCLHVFLPWLQTEYAPEATVWPNITALHSIWETIGGVPLKIADKRWLLIPSESLDSAELEVPQEWVDIPNWAADYYLAIQLDLHEHACRVWAYTSHLQLKQNAVYDPSDRAYSLTGQALIRDLNAFWNTCQFCPDAITQADIAPLPPLSHAQAEYHIRQLSLPTVSFPRLALPFQRWAALLSHEPWRRQLYLKRLSALSTESHPPSPAHIPNPWFEAGWLALESLVGTHQKALAPPLRTTAAASGANEQRVKHILLNQHSDPQTVVLLMTLDPQPDGRIGVRVQIHPPRGRRHVPPNLTLAIYSDANHLLHSIQARYLDDYIQLPLFKCPSGTHFRLQVALDDDLFSENFAV